MGLETVVYIDDLNSSWPLGTDNRSEGDDHLRNIKAAILATFPNITGAVSLTQTVLNSQALNKFDATADPTVNEDSGDGYGVGSLWVNVTDDKAFVCLDATATAAVWQELGAGGGGGGGGPQMFNPF